MTRLDRYQQRTSVPLIVGALLFLVVAVPMFRPLRLLVLLTASERLFRSGGLEQGAAAVGEATVLVASVAELQAERCAPGRPSTASGTRCGGR